jgi:hypothetical protein
LIENNRNLIFLFETLMNPHGNYENEYVDGERVRSEVKNGDKECINGWRREWERITCTGGEGNESVSCALFSSLHKIICPFFWLSKSLL